MDELQFSINGQEYTVSKDTPGNTTLNSFIRNNANLRGTKSMCHEGGCGACTVSVATLHPVTKVPQIYSVNSCLVSVFSCHGWSIATVEGIGNQYNGYHPIQKRLAAFNGTQCGYCSPGWVMNMHSLYEDHKDDLTMAEVENSFAGNICRCTGYRPILDAFKTFSKDCDPKLAQQVEDIEELSGIKMCAKNGLICTKSCNDYSPEDDKCKIKMERPLNEMVVKKLPIHIDTMECKWFKIYSINEIFDILEKEGNDSYMLVAGNTAKGVYNTNTIPKIMIDISDVGDLKTFHINDNLVLGGNMTLTDTMKVFKKVSKLNVMFRYTAQMYAHLDLVAHNSVRNVGTIAGNLSIKHKHNEFPSDIFVIFEAVGATLTIAEKNSKEFNVTLTEYLSTDMKGRIIKSINLPPQTSDHIFHSYKIMPRSQNSHAHVNAAFSMKLSCDKSSVVEASIVYGGISPQFSHAKFTEKYILEKNIFDKETVKLILKHLSDEIHPEEAPPEPSAEYRKKLAVNLFYKFLLHITPSQLIKKTEVSGGEELSRPVSSGHQDFDTNKSVWPLNKPIPKVEAVIQCSGEAKYANDLPTLPGELYAAFVLSNVPNGTIENIDASEALKMKGVVAIFSAKDIPGKNSFSQFNKDVEEIFCSEKIRYNGQPVALIVAKTEQLANIAAEMVKVSYKDVSNKPPVLTVRQALKSPDLKERMVTENTITPTAEKGTDVSKVIKGSFDFYGQYHYTMETQTCVCIPTEDGIDVYPASQWMDLVQATISEVLNIPVNRINVTVRRLGGAYGGKISRPTLIAAACALAAVKLQCPMRIVMSMQANMMAIGKRLPYASDYEVGVNDLGKIQYLNCKFYADDGYSHNDPITEHALRYFTNCYDNSTWNVKAFSVLTDTACNTACRSPGTTEGVAMIENIMEHIAVETGRNPLNVRMENMKTEESALPELLETIKKSADFDQRCQQIEKFNNENIWRKRGISLLPLKYNFFIWGNFASMVSIYHKDGTVAISHAGIEMGQGINTKVAQVCAHILGIPMEKVSIRPSNDFTAPNAIVTGGSLASEAVCYATMKACQMLLERLEPIKKQMENPTWEELVQKAHDSLVDLCAHHMFTAKDDVKPYVIWAVTITEVEVDLLTGNHQVLRVDLLEDTGESLSPQVDIGQVEGAFVMGLGYWTSEKLVYDEKTGALLTNRSWNYKPPGAKDIPIDFRISFRRNSPNPVGVLRSKATGEPSLNTSITVVFAIRQALNAARKGNGKSINHWLHLEMPCTPENILLAADTKVF